MTRGKCLAIPIAAVPTGRRVRYARCNVSAACSIALV